MEELSEKFKTGEINEKQFKKAVRELAKGYGKDIGVDFEVVYLDEKTMPKDSEGSTGSVYILKEFLYMNKKECYSFNDIAIITMIIIILRNIYIYFSSNIALFIGIFSDFIYFNSYIFQYIEVFYTILLIVFNILLLLSKKNFSPKVKYKLKKYFILTNLIIIFFYISKEPLFFYSSRKIIIVLVFLLIELLLIFICLFSFIKLK